MTPASARAASPIQPLGAPELAAWLRGRPRLGLGREAPSARWRLERATVEILRNASGRRLTWRCRLALERAGGARRRMTVIAKQYARTDLARRLARHLRSLRFRPDGAAFRVPRLLGVDARRGVVFMEALPGTLLERAMLRSPLERELTAAGALLARFHGGVARAEKRVTRADELARVRDAGEIVARTFPELSGPLGRIGETLAGVAWPRGRDRILLHGSFRPNHLVLHRGELGVLDLESLRWGPAGYDIANWIAALHYREAVRRLARAVRRRATRAMLRGYRGRGGDESCVRVLWLAAGLMVQKQVLKLATRPHARARECARTLLAHAEALANHAATTHPGARLDRLLELLP